MCNQKSHLTPKEADVIILKNCLTIKKDYINIIMGFKSILVKLNEPSSYEFIINFVNKYYKQYDYCGLIFYEPTKEYYVLIECNGIYFCNLLVDKGFEVKYLENFEIEGTGDGYQIKNAIYFEDSQGCLNHYMNT